MDTLILRITIFILYLLFSNKTTAEEPKCYSRFDYDEKLIEKMIRAEIKLEEFAKRMDLNDATLGDIRTDFRNEIQSTKEKMVQDEVKLQELATRMDLNNAALVHGGWSDWSSWGSCSATCDVGLERRDRTCTNQKPDLFGDHCFGDNHEDRICRNSSCAGESAPIRKIAFSAQIKTVISATRRGQTFVFDAITINHGNGYSPSTGQFTAPQGGTYQFSYNVLFFAPSSSDNFCDFYLAKGSTVVVYSHSDTHSGKNGFSQSSVNYIIDLMKGDTVCVKSNNGNCNIFDNHFTFFSGVLLF